MKRFSEISNLSDLPQSREQSESPKASVRAEVLSIGPFLMGNILCCICIGSSSSGLAKIPEAPGHGRTVSEQFDSTYPKSPTGKFRHLREVPTWRRVLHLVQYLLRVFDWGSDFILLVVLLQQLVVAPSFELTMSKPVYGIVPMSFNYTAVDAHCSFDLSVPISNCTSSSRKILTMKLDPYELDITNECTSGESCCNKEIFKKRTRISDFNVQCPEGIGSRLIPDVVFVRGTPWICDKIQENESNYSCGFSGAFLLNILVIFTFVFICKEILVAANYRFTIYGMKSTDVAVVSCDSLMLLLVYALRYFDFFHDAFKNASLKISDNKAFFYTWIVLDFAEKIVSTTIALIVVTSGGTLLGALAYISLASSIFSFVMSWRMWYRRMKMALGLMAVDDYEEVVVKELERLSSRKCIPIDMIKDSHLEQPKCLDGFFSKLSYINLQFAVRILLAFACVVVWIVGQARFENFTVFDIENKSLKYIVYKCVGAAFCAFMISEIAVRSSSSSIAKGLLKSDISEAFLDPNARRQIQRKGSRFYRFVQNVYARLTFKQKLAVRLIYHPNAFEVFILYVVEMVAIAFLLGNFNFVLVELTSSTQSNSSLTDISSQVSDVTDQDRIAYNVLTALHILFIVFTALVQLNVLFQYMFTNPIAKRVMKTICCVESINREVLIHTVLNPIIYDILDVDDADPRIASPRSSMPATSPEPKVADSTGAKDPQSEAPTAKAERTTIIIDASKEVEPPRYEENVDTKENAEAKVKGEEQKLERLSSADNRKSSAVRVSDAPLPSTIESKPQISALESTPVPPTETAPEVAPATDAPEVAPTTDAPAAVDYAPVVTPAPSSGEDAAPPAEESKSDKNEDEATD